MLILALALSPAHAAADLQARLTPALLAFAEDQAEALDPSFESPDVHAKDVDCYDMLGILDFNLDVPVDRVDLELGSGRLDVVVELGEVWGQDMLVYGLDEDYLDTCAEFDAELLWVSLVDGRVEGSIAVDTAADGGLSLSWASEPVVTGDLDMDIDWFPDDLVLYFIEDALFESVSATLAESLLPELEAFAAEPLLDGDYADYAVLMALSGADASSAGLDLDVDADVAFMGQAECETGSAAGSGGSAPALRLDDPGGAHVLVGLTEAFVDDLMVESWKSGAYCGRSETFDELVEDLQGYVDSSWLDVDAAASLDAPPVLSLDADGARLRLEGLHITLDAEVDGDRTRVLDAAMDLQATAVPGLSAGGSLVGLSLADLQVDFGDFQVEGVSAGLEAYVVERVEAWAAQAMQEALEQVPLFDAAYGGYGLVVRIEDIAVEDGGLVLALRLYDEDDPQVDEQSPDTLVSLVDVQGDSATVAWTGTDDRSDTLAFAVQIDGLGWSDWTEDHNGTFHDLLEGPHRLEVKARDAWLNEDPSPAVLDFEVQPTQTGAEQLAEACGCGGGAASVLGLPPAMLLVAMRRRRQRAAV